MMLIVLRMMLTRSTQRRVKVSGTRLSIRGSIVGLIEISRFSRLFHLQCKSHNNIADKIADTISPE